MILVREYGDSNSSPLRDLDPRAILPRMLLVFISGPVASGKLTVARELEKLTGFPVFHNHLVVDALLSVFPFGSPEFIELRERFWLETIEAAATTGMAGLIFTFAPENTVRQGFVPELVRRLELAGAKVRFVALRCDDAEIERRLVDQSRAQFGKLRSLESYRALREARAFDFPRLPVDIVVDSGANDPASAARFIADRLT